MSLHWILMLTVTLLHCLMAHPIDGEIRTLIKILKKHNCREPDSTFYSPSGTKNCTIQALDCSMKEVDVVILECFDDKSPSSRFLNRTRDRIKQTMTEMNITLPGKFENCFCGEENPNEKPDKKPYKEFLDNILTLLEMLNSSRD